MCFYGPSYSRRDRRSNNVDNSDQRVEKRTLGMTDGATYVHELLRLHAYCYIGEAK